MNSMDMLNGKFLRMHWLRKHLIYLGFNVCFPSTGKQEAIFWEFWNVNKRDTAVSLLTDKENE